MKIAIIGTDYPLRRSLKARIKGEHPDVIVLTPEQYLKLPYRGELPKVDFNQEPQIVELRVSFLEMRKNKKVARRLKKDE